MYAWYRRTINQNGIQLEFEEEASLGGCNNGIIANELKKIITPLDSAPFGWTLPIANYWNREDYSFIVDIKPKNKNEVFLCELDRVFGYCYNEWTPVMLRLKSLNIENPNKKDFIYPDDPDETEILYTMYYLYGSVSNGNLTGTWNPPFGSITALLFWPHAMTFFFRQVEKYDPGFLHKDIKLMTNWN